MSEELICSLAFAAMKAHKEHGERMLEALGPPLVLALAELAEYDVDRARNLWDKSLRATREETRCYFILSDRELGAVRKWVREHLTATAMEFLRLVHQNADR